MLRGTCDSPVLHPLPFSNLRLQKQHPGFEFDIGEKRLGEHPWRPASMDAGRQVVQEEDDRGSMEMGQQEYRADSQDIGDIRGQEFTCDSSDKRKEAAGW